MIKIILIIIFAIYFTPSLSSKSSHNRRLLQQFTLPQQPNIPIVPNNPNNLPQIQPSTPISILGFWGQQCNPATPQMTCISNTQIVSDMGNGKVECNVPYSCCLCQTVYCGYNPGQGCDGILAGAPYALYGVKQVALQGEPMTPGAIIDCGAQNACAETNVIGQWVNTIKCAGPDACNNAEMTFEQSMGIICSTRSCVGAKFTLNSNRGGGIICSAPDACMDATITINGMIQDIMCGGTNGCKNAKITLTNPMEGLLISCGGRSSCENLELEIIIPYPIGGCPILPAGMIPPFIEWKGITCGAQDSCKGLKLTLENNGCNPIRLEDFECQPNQACGGSIFNFHGGISPYDITLQNCKCGASCRDASGIDKCFQNVRIIECLDVYSCSNQVQVLYNIANGFILLCPNYGSCQGLDLTIDISGNSQNLVRRIVGFNCDGILGCAGSTFKFSNTQLDSYGNSVQVVVSSVTCGQSQSCDGTTFILGDNVSIEYIICALPDSCNNCYIKTSEFDLNPTPCDPSTPAPITTTTTAPPVIATTATGLTTAAGSTTAASGVAASSGTSIPTTAAPAIPEIPSIPSIPSIPAVNPQTSTPSPVTPAPVTASPITAAQVTPALVTPAPVTQVPVTPSPITPAPVTPAPITSSPITAAPVTAQVNPADVATVPELPIAPQPIAPSPIQRQQGRPVNVPSVPDVPQTGGAPAPPALDPIETVPISDPVAPVVQTGGTVTQGNV